MTATQKQRIAEAAKEGDFRDLDCRFYVLIAGKRHYLSRSVTDEHDEDIHRALGTSSEIDLQRFLDQCYVGYWFDEGGNYLGEDDYGLGVEVEV